MTCPDCKQLKAELDKARAQLSAKDIILRGIRSNAANSHDRLTALVEKARSVASRMPCLDATPDEPDTVCLTETPRDLCETCAVRQVLEVGL